MQKRPQGHLRPTGVLRPQRERYLRKLDLPGITLQDTQKRLYPLGSVAAQLVGMTDDWGVGLTGLEKTMESYLKGKEGMREEARDPNGQALQILEDRAPTPGTPITLTLNSAVQQKTEAVLAKVVDENDAKAASAIVMKADTGEVLAMATVPGFNPNDRDTFKPDTERVRSITDAYEPGSTFKVVAVAGAIEDGAVTRNTSFSLPETLTLYDRTLKEAHYRPAVSWTTQEILQNSSNVGTVMIAQKLGEEAVELVIAAMARDRAEIIGEASDLMFHLTVLLADAGLSFDDIRAELARREGMSGLAEKASRKS